MSTVHDGRTPPFCWQSTTALSGIRNDWKGLDDQGNKRVGAHIGLAVYLALSELANEDRARTAIGVASEDFEAPRARIAERAGGINERSVDFALSELKRLGLLNIKSRRERRLPSIFTLTESTSGVTPHVPKLEASRPQTSGVTPHALAASRRTYSRSTRKEAAARSDEEIDLIFCHWQQATGRSDDDLTPTRKRAVQDALGFTTSSKIMEAMDNWERSDWFSGRKARDGRVRNDITDLLTSIDVVEELRGLGRDRSNECIKHLCENAA